MAEMEIDGTIFHRVALNTFGFIGYASAHLHIVSLARGFDFVLQRAAGTSEIRP